MLRHTMALAAFATLLAACSENNPTTPTVRALAAPRNASAAVDHTLPGTPGTPNCKGQSAAYLAQLAKNAGVQDFRGIGGIAVDANLTVQEVQAAIDTYCAQ